MIYDCESYNVMTFAHDSFKQMTCLINFDWFKDVELLT